MTFERYFEPLTVFGSSAYSLKQYGPRKLES